MMPPSQNSRARSPRAVGDTLISSRRFQAAVLDPSSTETPSGTDARCGMACRHAAPGQKGLWTAGLLGPRPVADRIVSDPPRIEPRRHGAVAAAKTRDDWSSFWTATVPVGWTITSSSGSIASVTRSPSRSVAYPRATRFRRHARCTLMLSYFASLMGATGATVGCQHLCGRRALERAPGSRDLAHQADREGPDEKTG